MQLWLLGAWAATHAQDLADDPQAARAARAEMEEQYRCYVLNNGFAPIAVLSHWRLVVWTVQGDSVRAPVTTLSPDGSTVRHSSITMTLRQWQIALQTALTAAWDALGRDLLMGLTEAPHFPLSGLSDNFTDFTPGHSFLDLPSNGVTLVQDWLYRQIVASLDRRTRFFDRANRPRKSAMMSNLRATQRFLSLLALLIYWSSGLPPRRKELAGMRWCNDMTPRNVYVHFGQALLITGYHKSQWRVGVRPIARTLAPPVGELLVRYLIYIPPWTRYLEHWLATKFNTVCPYSLNNQKCRLDSKGDYSLRTAYVCCPRKGGWNRPIDKDHDDKDHDDEDHNDEDHDDEDHDDEDHDDEDLYDYYLND